VRKIKIILVLLSLVLVFSLPHPARANTRVYISISIGGGALIGMVGYYFHVTYSSRVAQKKKEDSKEKELSKIMAFNTSYSSIPHRPLSPWKVPPCVGLCGFNSPNPEAPPPNRLDVNLFTYHW